MEVRAVSRALDVLSLVAQAPASLTEIAAGVSLSKATVHRLLQTLQGRGFVRLDPGHARYVLGAAVEMLAHTTDRYIALKQAARPIMAQLRDRTGETVLLTVREGDERLTLHVVLSPKELRVAPDIGVRKPVHAGAAGKALLAGLDDQQLQDIAERTSLLPVTARTVSSLGALKREIKAIALRGYTVSIEETVDGQAALGVPIRIAQRTVAALVVCGPVQRFKPLMLKSMVSDALRAAAALERAVHAASPDGHRHARQRAPVLPGSLTAPIRRKAATVAAFTNPL